MMLGTWLKTLNLCLAKSVIESRKIMGSTSSRDALTCLAGNCSLTELLAKIFAKVISVTVTFSPPSL